MSEELALEAAPMESRPEPAPRRRSAVVARRMRMLTGVREELLDKIPAERTRYTALAAVMICTASIGGFSMFFALSEIMGSPEIWFVLLAAFWAVFVLCIDCWLVSSTAGSRWRTRISVLLPRLLIAAVFGVAIAEPLVLRVFQTGIVNHVRQERQTAIDTLQTALVDCNPVPGIAAGQHAPPGGCAGSILSIPNPAAATLARVQVLRGQASALQTQVNTETTQLARLQNTVNDECNGLHGTGLTGVVGNGPACHTDQRYVSNYRASNPIASQNARTSNLNDQVSTLQGSLSGQQASYRTAISQAIARRLRAETPPSAPIGMAERFQALSYLSLTNGFIGVASWFVRLIFILIDCLPVLVKFISGSTPYDRLANIEISSSEKRFSRRSDVRDTIADEDNAVILRKARTEAAWRKKEIDLETLRQDTARETDKEDAVDELWRKKLDARRSSRASAERSAGNSRPPRTSFNEHDQPVRT